MNAKSRHPSQRNLKLAAGDLIFILSRRPCGGCPDHAEVTVPWVMSFYDPVRLIFYEEWNPLPDDRLKG